MEQNLTVLAIVLGPIVAVLLTLWLQDRNRQLLTKQQLFLQLMAHRKTFPPPVEWVSALNLIDVVFAKSPKVVTSWHVYHEYLSDQKDRPDFAPLGHKYLELLSSIAHDLGYKKLQQTDIDKFYEPLVYGERAGQLDKLQSELLRVLENTASIVITPRS